MRIVYTTTFNAKNVHKWSGTPYYMARHLSQKKEVTALTYVGSLKRILPFGFKFKKKCKALLGLERDSAHFNTTAAYHYSLQAKKKLLSYNADVIISPLINPIAYLDCKQPIVLWTDAVYSSLVGFYPGFSRHSAKTIHQGNALMTAGLTRCQLAIFSSEWAAESAMTLYGISKDKIKVIPFGANIDSYPSLDEIRTIVQKRSHQKTIKLLFLGKDWERKGLETVLAVTKALHKAGYAVELIIAGCNPKLSLPPYVHLLGFISKQTPEGREQFQNLLKEAHFLFIPSKAEAYGIAFAEASAYALPSLTTYIGGISTVVKNHINGMTFALDATLTSYCDYITATFANHALYEDLCLSSYNEFKTRLNWPIATQKAIHLIKEII